MAPVSPTVAENRLAKVHPNKHHLDALLRALERWEREQRTTHVPPSPPHSTIPRHSDHLPPCQGHRPPAVSTRPPCRCEDRTALCVPASRPPAPQGRFSAALAQLPSFSAPPISLPQRAALYLRAQRISYVKDGEGWGVGHLSGEQAWGT